MRIYRQFLLLMLFALFILVLSVRMLWLQVKPTFFGAPDVSSSDLVQSSVKQRRVSIVLDDGRGRIVDRAGKPLVGIETKALLMLPSNEEVRPEQARKLAEILGINNWEWKEQTKQIGPMLWRKKGDKWPYVITENQATAIKQLHVPGVAIVPYIHRYDEPPIATHLIGYVAENPYELERQYTDQLRDGQLSIRTLVGGSGIEKSFERFLHPRGQTKYVTYVDGRSRAMNGLNGEHGKYVSTMKHYAPIQIVTTIDNNLQRKLEDLMNRQGIQDGAAVILDASNGDLAAMVSKPDYNPNSVVPEEGRWQNQSIKPEIPGSIFKTVVAAAALEAGEAKPGEHFQCNGEWSTFRLRCWRREGHGEITLEQAFAESCNITFAKLAVQLGAQRLMETANKLGVGRKVGWSRNMLETPFGKITPFHQFADEGSGQLFASSTNRTDPAVLAQSGIGQRDVRLSPLQAANMVIAIVNGGWIGTPRVVSEVRTSKHHQIMAFPLAEHRSKAISDRTARWLMHAMQLTVSEGTARLLEDVPGGVGGKTGTAETGIKGKVQHWFIGYAPLDHPKYTFAIMIRNQNPAKSNQAMRLARELLGANEYHKP